MKNKLLILMLALGAVARIYKLMDVPAGLSLFEVQLGSFLAQFFGNFVLNEVVIRFPFVIIGIFDLYILYKLAIRLGLRQEKAILATGMFTFLPWHIHYSRIASLELPILTIVLLGVLFCLQNKNQQKLVSNGIWFICIILFAISVLIIPQNIRTEVESDRNDVRLIMQGKKVSLFANKLVESSRSRITTGFESLDFGNYFFAGHPRERLGVEEMQKLYIVLLPVLIVGLFNYKKENLNFIGSIFIFCIILSTLVPRSLFDANILLFVPIALTLCMGLAKIDNNILIGLGIVVYIFEFSVFMAMYLHGYNQSSFNPRRPVYKEIYQKVAQVNQTDVCIAYDTRLVDFDQYYAFYSKNDFPVCPSGTKPSLQVGLLPDDATPSEKLYKLNGNWPDGVSVLNEIHDEKTKNSYIIYK